MRPPSKRQDERRAAEAAQEAGPGWGAAALSVLLAAVAGFGAGTLGAGPWLASLGLVPAPAASIAPADRPAGAPAAGLLPRLTDSLNVLFMATDVDVATPTGLRGRTDTMMLVRLDPRSNQVRMLSIPRDTRVAVPGHGAAKINAANPYGGPELAAQVVADFLGVQVDRFVLVNTRGVVQLVDELGGVDVYVPKDLHYDDFSGKLHIHLPKGWNHLDGQAAQDFLRFRHDELGDIGRVQRQQAFMQALLKQYLTPMNLLRTPRLLAAARENMATNLSQDELVRIVGWGKDLTQEQVQLAMVPGRDGWVRGGWYWLPDEAGTRRLVDTFLTGEQEATARAPHEYRVAIVDGVGDRQAVGRLRQALRGAGYVAVELDGPAAQPGQSETQIIAQRADVPGARAMAETLGLGKVVVAATGNLHADFTIVMGRDWASIARATN